MGGYSVVGLLVSLTALVLNVVLNLILIPRYGMTGSAIAWGTSIVFNNIAALAAAWRLLGIGPVGRGFILIAISSVATFGGLGLLTRAAFGTSVLAFIGYLIVACALYGAILYRLRGTLQLAALMDGFRSRNTLPPSQHRQGPVRRSV
jgi:O-antigen/teichoic acid export membrane protein